MASSSYLPRPSSSMTLRPDRKIVSITDNTLVHKNVVKRDDLVPINMSQIKNKLIKPEDIVQKNIGNCYFLSALQTLLERDPKAIHNILRVNEKGYIEVTFHSSQDPTQTYTYIMEPTKVFDKNNANPHTHDAIFLLEKAYAIHRMETEPLQYGKRELAVRDVIMQSSSKKQALETLVEMEMKHVASEQKKLHGQIYEVLTMYGNHVRDYNEKQRTILSELLLNDLDVDKTFEGLKTKIDVRSEASLNMELNRVYKKMETRVDYIGALTEGHSKDAFVALLGSEAKDIQVSEPTDVRYFLTIFLPNIHMLPTSEFDKRTIDTLKKIFGEIDSPEALFFIASIKNTNVYPVQELLSNYDSMPDNKSSLQNLLIDFLNNNVKWVTDTTTLDAKTMHKLINFINQHVPHKRGLGIYTEEQENMYAFIKSNLVEGNLITIATSKEVMRYAENRDLGISKGLLGSHGYPVINCWERDGRKYLLVRNIWDKEVRDYQTKQKTLDGKPVEVLSAVGKQQIDTKASNLLRKFSSFSGIPTRDKSITNSAFPVNAEQLGSHGYFELELTDVQKRFKKISIAKPNKSSGLKL